MSLALYSAPLKGLTLGIMKTIPSLADALELKQELERRLVGLRFENKPRQRVAYACYSIAREHYSAILLLLQQDPPSYATAFALLRPALEATLRALRGEWIAECASDEHIKSFALGGKRQLDMSSLVAALQKNSSSDNMHSVLYKDLWPIVSAYTHTYEYQLQHWISLDPPIPNYAPEQVAWLLNAAMACFALCVSSTRRLAKEDGVKDGGGWGHGGDGVRS